MSTFKPMKAPNEELIGRTAYDKACTLQYPLIGSYKLDGFRCIFNEGQMRTASLKQFNNVHINKRFQPIVDFIKSEPVLNPLLDGELITPSLPFNVFSGIFRSDEMPLPGDTRFNLFDVVLHERYDERFEERIKQIAFWAKQFPDLIQEVEQRLLHTPEEVVAYYEEALSHTIEYQGEEHTTCDGLMLRSPSGRYKCGRGTMKEGLIYKLKPYQTFDAKIIGVEEGTNVDPNVAKTTNELGRSVTSKKKGDRLPGGWAKSFIVQHEGQQELAVSIKATFEEKCYIFKHPSEFIGKHVEYKGLMVGAKDLPRHPTQVRMRPDKD